MKGCNTLTLCPAQMHEAVEFWLKNQVLRAEHAASVKVIDVRRKSETIGCYGFEIEMRETEVPIGKCIPVELKAGETIKQALERAARPPWDGRDGVVGD